jgi:hypothetical protein
MYTYISANNLPINQFLFKHFIGWMRGDMLESLFITSSWMMWGHWSSVSIKLCVYVYTNIDLMNEVGP